MRSIEVSLARLQALGRVSETEADAVLTRVNTTVSMEAAADDADVVVESVYEDLELKRAVFGELDRRCPVHTVFASNSSTLMPSTYAGATERPDRVVGVHFINPPFLVPLVEVVPSAETSASTIQTVTQLLTQMGKRPIVLKRDAPGFVASRLQGALLREALWIVENGVAGAQDVDVAIKTSIGRRWAVAGVFEVLDIAGWDLMQATPPPSSPIWLRGQRCLRY